MKEKIVMVLRKHMPPLGQENIDAISEEIMVEWRKAGKQLTAEHKKKASKTSGKTN